MRTEARVDFDVTKAFVWLPGQLAAPLIEAWQSKLAAQLLIATSAFITREEQSQTSVTAIGMSLVDSRSR